ncbi:MAG: tRNA1(Val) (adenine(37)-N6)-methyltransferase [Lachnospiraceae bacterium]|nr:tRNA1(Val) (adenine(37)-N6)-methyltransferase [Lachnospiraceae bacterium]
MERIDELQRGGFRLIQDPDCFCFGTDAVLLADFARASSRDKVLDLCAGSGVVSLLMLARYPGAHYTALELQKPLADMARRSMELNEVTDRVSVLQGDLREIRSMVSAGAFDVLTVNPPYMKGQTIQNVSEAVRLARHEDTCTLRDVCEAAAYALKYHGKLFMVHRPERLAEIFSEMERVRLTPKVMQLVQPFSDKGAAQVLIQAVSHGAPGMKVLPTLNTYRSPGIYTEEMLKVYGMDGHVHPGETYS